MVKREDHTGVGSRPRSRPAHQSPVSLLASDEAGRVATVVGMMTSGITPVGRMDLGGRCPRTYAEDLMWRRHRTPSTPATRCLLLRP